MAQKNSLKQSPSTRTLTRIRSKTSTPLKHTRSLGAADLRTGATTPPLPIL